MAVAEFLEDIVSHLPALHLLQHLGYQYLTPAEAVALRGGKRSRVVLDAVLLDQLRKLNQITFKGEKHEFTDANLRAATDALTNLPFDGLVKTNEQAFDLLTLGKSLEQTIDGNKKSYSLRYIDWETPANNVFHVADEFEVERTGSHETRRPDLVLFVNGIPLSVVECKRPDEQDAVDVGVSQTLRNQRADEVPHLFVFSQLLLSICQNQGKYATTGTPKKFWAAWREENAPHLDTTLAKMVNTPLPAGQWQRVFDSRPPHTAARMQEIAAAGERLPSPQDRILYCLLRPERLLELTRGFVLFDKDDQGRDIKKVARYQQYFAIQETMARVRQAKGDEAKTGGIIWHTTGSGKSLTMVMLAKALTLEPSVKNPRVVIVTDRVDLDGQIFRTFVACRKEVQRAASGEHLVELVRQGKAVIITTIIDKFESAATKHHLRDAGSNVFVLVDESHRTQSGIAHAKMKQVFPNACFVGFTGTPLLKGDKATARKFGGFIHSYPMRQAVEDKAVTPILYEGRMAELHGDQKAIDKWFDRITKDLSDEQKADLKRKFRREEELTKTPERLYEVAFDIATHFTENFHGTKFKGQFAVSSKAIALQYHTLFAEIGRDHPTRKVTTRVVISPPDTREDNETIDEADLPELQRFWKGVIDEYKTEEKYMKWVIDAFETKAEPEIIICVDKLLTGFDAPCNTVLYIDKRLKDHNVLQAIARVNRLFDGKDFGLVIDYRGIFGDLDAAVRRYDALSGFDEEDIEGTFIPVDEEVAKLAGRHANVWAVFNGVANKKDTEAMQQHLRPKDVRQDFYSTLNQFAKTLQIAMGSAKFHETTDAKVIAKYVEDLKRFRSLRAAVKTRYNEAVDYSEYEDQIRNMVNKYVGADEVRRVIEPVNIFQVRSLADELEGIEGTAAKADFIASRVKRTCTEKMDEDPILWQKLSQVIDEAIKAYLEKRLTEEEYLQQMLAAWREAQGQGSSVLPPELQGQPDAKAYFRLLLDGVQKVAGTHGRTDLAAVAAETALKAKKAIDDRRIRDWTDNRDVENAMLNALEDLLYGVKGRYDIPLQPADMDHLLTGLMRVAKRRDATP